MKLNRLSLLVAALAAAGLFLFAPAAGVASPHCDEYDTSTVCDADQPVEGADPIGALDATTYSWGWNTGSTQHTIVVSGWALDSDASGPIDVRLDVDTYSGSTTVTGRASHDHGFEIVIALPFWQDALYGSFCVTALNAGPGVDTGIGCDSWVNS